MPEQLTKHPEVTLQVLASTGAPCGVGAKQEILTACPPERFCKLPGGEMCVFGLPDAKRMTQIDATEWRSLAGPPTATGYGVELLAVATALALVLGLALGLALSRRRR